MDPDQLAADIRSWAVELGFDRLGITDTDLGEHPAYLQRWLDAGHHASMAWMTRNLDKRNDPVQLVPGTIRILSVRMHYSPPRDDPMAVLQQTDKAYVSRYALGRDYHKVVRPRLAQLARRIDAVAGPAGFRAFADSAPVLEKAIAQKAGLGWIGKNTLLLSRDAGSLFFLGELFTDLPLPVDVGFQNDHCGSCSACLDICPTDAFVGPRQLDAGRCISYLTIEHRGAIPEPLRAPMGNRIFGCDDCQLVCPWNKWARLSAENDFHPRHGLEGSDLIELFEWSEDTFLERTAGSPIRRTGYSGWLRNLAVALGNAPASARIVETLNRRRPEVDTMVQEHIDWALARQQDGLREA